MAGDPRVFELLEEMLDSGSDAGRSVPRLPGVASRGPASGGRRSAASTRKSRRCFHRRTPAQCDATRPNLPADLPQIPGYEVEAVLGHGGMGVVYQAWHLRLQSARRPENVAGRRRTPSRRSGSGSSARRRRSPRCSTPTSCRSTTSARWTAGRTSRWSWSRAATWPSKSRGLRSRLARRPPWWRRWPTPSTRPTSAGSSIATSSRRNVLLTADGTPKVTDFGLARRLEGDERADAQRRAAGHARATWPRSRRGATRAPSGRRPTSTRWGRSCTSC